MKRKVITRSLLGAPQGIAICMIITIICSLGVGDGNYYPVVPEFMSVCENELSAVILQAVCSLVYGAVWGGASAIWENENWSILRQTATHLAVCSIASLPIAYFLRWMDHSLLGVAAYFGIFFGIYFFVWVAMYFSIRKRIEQINKKVEENNSKDEK